jgi:Na+-transporting methylmalonyl-CoA/oxaloacetate decarboxylase gamma subunit
LGQILSSYQRRYALIGIENISANNGWAMAVIGITIVFLGLVVLAFVISQIHKILAFWEKRQQKSEKVVAPEQKPQEPVPDLYPLDAKSLADTYRPLVEQLGKTFNLSQLFEITKINDLPHPHLSINCLREADMLIPQGDGTFSWKK